MWETASSAVKNWLDSGAPNNLRLWGGFGLIVVGLGFLDFAYALIGLGAGMIVWHLAIMDPDEESEATE